MDKRYDVQESIKAQKEHCQAKKYPHFAPTDGICYRCRRQIYSPFTANGFTSGITVEKAGKELITGCPHCNYSYCD